MLELPLPPPGGEGGLQADVVQLREGGAGQGVRCKTTQKTVESLGSIEVPSVSPCFFQFPLPQDGAAADIYYTAGGSSDDWVYSQISTRYFVIVYMSVCPRVENRSVLLERK